MIGLAKEGNLCVGEKKNRQIEKDAMMYVRV